MAEIRPFRAFRYNPARVDWSKVLTQPYDKITPEMQERYYQLDPHNLIVVEKGKSFPGDAPPNDVYGRAAAKLNEWIAAGILVQDPKPCFYAYTQDFHLPGSKTRRTRRGLIALGRLEDYSTGVVFRHEQTLTAPKADRLELLRRTRAQTGQLFLLYSDPGRTIDARLAEVAQAPPACELRDEYDVLHRLWLIDDPELISEFQQAMASRQLVIADGHHRYETALAFRDECRAARDADGAILRSALDPNAPHEFAMMTLINAHSEGLTILPTHRVVSGLHDFSLEALRAALQPNFDWYAYPYSSAEERAQVLENFRRDLVARGKERRSFGVVAAPARPESGAFYLFLLRADANLNVLLPDHSPAQRRLDVVLLHHLILEKTLGITAEAVRRESHLRYEREIEAAVGAVLRGEAQVAFLLNPVRVETVMEMALAGEVLPQKSTDFYPKLLSGIAIYRL